MKRGFHWFTYAEWAFLLLTVLLALGVASDGFSERSVLGTITNTFFAFLDVIALALTGAAAVVALANGLGVLAFFALFALGLVFFRERVLEIGMIAVIMLFAIAVLFGGIYA
jgi:hypothetical protein